MTESKQKEVADTSLTGGVVGGSDKSSFSRRFSFVKKPVAGLLVLVLVVLLAGGTYMWQTMSSPKCSKDIVFKSREALNPLHSDELPPIAEQVLKIKDYQKDANCAYIVTVYYVQTGNAPKARASFNDLQKVYPKDGVSKDLGPYAQDIDKLETRVKAAEEWFKSFQMDTAGYPVIGPGKKE